MKNALILESFTTTLTAAGEGNKRKRVLRPTPGRERALLLPIRTERELLECVCWS
jgi:hypothetical protein